MPDLEAVLARIESNLNAAYERSRSTDPAYAQEYAAPAPGHRFCTLGQQ